jgi:hypothetical protein
LLSIEEESRMALSATRSAAILTLAALGLATPASWAGNPSTSQSASTDSQVTAGKQGAKKSANRMGAQSGKQPHKRAPGSFEVSSFSFGSANVGSGKPGSAKAGNAAGSLQQIQVQPPGSAASAQLPKKPMFVPPPK